MQLKATRPKAQHVSFDLMVLRKLGLFQLHQVRLANLHMELLDMYQQLQVSLEMHNPSLPHRLKSC